jgi:hypothetical protein
LESYGGDSVLKRKGFLDEVEQGRENVAKYSTFAVGIFMGEYWRYRKFEIRYSQVPHHKSIFVKQPYLN